MILAVSPFVALPVAGLVFCLIQLLAAIPWVMAVFRINRRALASLLRLRLVAIAMDEQGLVPDALDAACHAGSVRALYTMPTLHNPTTATMPMARREAVMGGRPFG